MLTNTAPYYDCPPWIDGDYSRPGGDVWFLVVFDGTTVPCWKDGNMTEAYGCAVYQSDTMFLAIESNGWKSGTPRYPGQTILQHEIEHLKCRCSWHG